MQLAVAHSNLDFDSLASQLAVSKLWPDTLMVPGRTQCGNVKEFLSLYRDHLPLVDVDYIDWQSVSHVFIVDCQYAERLDEPVSKLISGGTCTYSIFDHHDLGANSLLPGARQDSIVRPAGACTTLLVDQLRQKNQLLSKFEATLLAIGIYEDSGCLTYGGTTACDAACIAYLLEQGADLAQVSTFINSKLGNEQTELLQQLIQNCRTVTSHGTRTLVASAHCERYVEGLATLTRRLLEMIAAEASVTVVFMRDRIHVVARSDSVFVDVRELIRTLGGDGHRGAASAVVKNDQLQSVVARVIAWLEEHTKRPLTAGQIMRTPARTISADLTIQEAARLMLRYNENGLVVIEGQQIEGIISKRDIDKAVHHKLEHARVKGFMGHPVITVNLDTPLNDIQALMVKHDIGRLPVLDDNGVFRGIVTRKEVLRTLFGGTQRNGKIVSMSSEKRMADWAKKLKKLDAANDWLFHEIGAIAGKLSMRAYAVGGCVRDLILDRTNFDLDFMAEGNAIVLAHALQEAYPGRFTVVAEHERFQTATLVFHADTKREVDLSTARIEFYEKPAALPTVEPSVLEQDLYRRDFTINSLAFCLNPDCYGQLIDFFDGIDDLQRKFIRILHPFSFVEDPTRIIRAVRFATRLGFQLEEETRRQAERAASLGVFDNLGGFRLKEELKLVLESPQRMDALNALESLGGGLRYLDSRLHYDRSIKAALRRANRLLARNPLKEVWIIYLGVLLSPLSSDELSAVMDRLVLSNVEREWIADGLSLLKRINASVDPDNLTAQEVYKLLHGHSDQALALAASLALPGSRVRRWIKLYLDKLRFVHVFLSGHDLLKAGFPEGPEIGNALEKLKEAKLSGKVKTAAQEMAFIKENYAQYL
jgi:tRNA nucleotidyltransferase (CCA-adding enzyme)